MQQPSGHDVALQTHAPVPLHVWPDGHALHAAPPAPHESFVSLESPSHELAPPSAALSQQPGHEVPAHPQEPVSQDSPDAHALHDAPPVPHSSGPCAVYATHVFPLQHPLGHDVASHTHWPLALHSCPGVAHESQTAPFVPHTVFDCDPYPSHVPPVPPLQQPFEHVVALQEHVPFVRSQTPLGHVPHAAPFVPHWDGDSDV